MTSPNLIELTFSSTALFDVDGHLRSRFLKGWPGETPMVRGEDDVVAAMTGRSFYPKIGDHLDIEIEITVAETAEAAFRAECTALYALFDATAAPAALDAVLEDGSTATINAYVVPPVLTRELVPGLVAQIEVALISIDPTWVITPAGS
jgi:hypothetical protein